MICVGIDVAKDNEELKSLTRYRFDKVKERAKLKSSISRLVCILFPELEKLDPTLHMASVYALLLEYPGAKQIADANLTHLKAVLHDASRGRYGRDMAVELREVARNSIGSCMPAKSLELRHTIRLIQVLNISCRQEAGQANLCHGEVRTALPPGNLIGFFTIYTIFFLSAACDALLAVPSFAGFRNLQNPPFHA